VRRVLLVALGLTSLALAALVTVTGTQGRAEAGPHHLSAPDPEQERMDEPHLHGDAATGTTVTETDVAPPLPVCTVADEPASAASYDDWRITLLDTRYALHEGYVPPDLVAVSTAFPPESVASAGGRLRALVIDDLRALVTDAAAAGHLLAVQSAYRDYRYQADTFQYWVDLQGLDNAMATSARAGHSEHQLGTALDLRSLHGPAAWDLEDWATTPEGAWVAANAWRYGFVMSYPRGRHALTCYAYEPWHYRYVGRELASQIHASGLTAREVLWTLRQAQPTTADRGSSR
jgi:D-alanyl-D-alanine carboxypeptidase